MRLVLSHSFVSGVLLAVSCGLLWGQGKPKRGTLNIEVVDPAGNAIPHAEVRFSPLPEDASSKLETATNGKLTLNLKPGNYTLVVACPGFKTSSTPITGWAAGPRALCRGAAARSSSPSTAPT